MSRAVIITSLVAIAVVGCRGSRSVEPVTSDSTPATEPDPTPAPAFEVHEIPVAGDGRSLPIALAETDGGLVLFAPDPTGLGRHAIDLDAGTATVVGTLPLERYPGVVGYDRAHDRLWWAGPVEQLRLGQPSRDGDFPSPDLVVTYASEVAHSNGLRETIRVCPGPVGGLGAGAGGPLCDHQIRVLLPAFDGVVIAGQLAERVGQAGAAPWIGFVDPGGALTAERRLPEGMGEAWIGALAQSQAGVLAVAWSGRGEPARSSFLLFGGPTLEPIATAARTTPSWIATPWSAAVAAPDGSFWVALTTASHELTILAIARDGSIASEHPIEGAELPITSVQSLGLRDGQPWLMIASPYHDPQPTLSVARVDPATGATPERHEIPLPADFYPTQMLALDRGFVLAGRVGIERPLVVWIRDRLEQVDRCAEPVPDEVLAITGAIVDFHFTNDHG
ncbi:MAG TPA: hypothetical protein VK034_24990, partial [Enhygromyxa sp.]|nr:hypothetical protein [Enhygromyxa sp.]